MNRNLTRALGLAGATGATVAAMVVPAGSAHAAPPSPRTDNVRCATEITASATSGKNTTVTRCLKNGRRVAPPPSSRSKDVSATAPQVQPRGVVAGARSQAQARGWVSTALQFRNSTASTVSVTIMYYDPNSCRGYGDWGTQGWWNIAPGQVVTVKNTSNRYATFHAYSNQLTWSGPYQVYVQPWAFTSCVNLGTTSSRIVGERLVDLGDVSAYPYTTHTVNLVG